MPRSDSRRVPGRRIDRRLLGAAGALVVFGGIIGVTQISSAETNTGPDAPRKTVNGLEILTDTCADSTFEAHDGFQNGDRCVSTEFGEVAGAAKNPSLLITRSPRSVRVGEPFELKVATRNLVRDRFLAAGKGGYYVESSVLTGDGLVRGHFHTACRMLTSAREANDPAPVPAFFVATEDGRGSADSDTVTIQVPGMPSEGVAQCASWAGDGSHRVPMTERANQTPAFDAVRIRVEGGGDQPPAEEPPAEEPPAEKPPAEEPPAEEPPAEEPPAKEPPAEEPPAKEEPPAAEEEAEQPPVSVNNQPSAGSPVDAKPAATKAAATKPTTKATAARQATKPASGSDSSDESAQSGNVAGSGSGNVAGSGDDGNSVTGNGSRSGDGAGSGDEAASGNDAGDAPKPRRSSAATEALVDNGDGADTGAPDPGQGGGDRRAQPPATEDTGGLALTGANTMAVIGGGSVLLLIGFVVLSATRRRRPRPARDAHWY